MRYLSTILSIFGVLTLSFVPADSASACSAVPPDGWLMPNGVLSGQTIEGVPLEGVLAIGASAATWPPTDVTVTCAVRQGDQPPLDGIIELDRRLKAIVWRAAQPLAPATQYDVTLSITSPAVSTEPQLYTFSFITAATAKPALTAPLVANLRLTDRAQGNRVCCQVKAEYSLCGETSTCWSSEYIYLPRVTGELMLDIPATLRASTYVVTRRSDAVGNPLDEGTSLPLYLSASGQTIPVAVDYADEQSSYCLVAEVHSVIDGSSLKSSVVCAAHETLAQSEREKRSSHNFVRECAAQPRIVTDVYGHAVDAPYSENESTDHSLYFGEEGDDTADIFDCSITAASFGSGPGLPFLANIALLATLALLRRRHRARLRDRHSA